MEQAEKYLGKFFRIDGINAIVFSTETRREWKTNAELLVLNYINEVGGYGKVSEEQFSERLMKTKNLSEEMKKSFKEYVKARNKVNALEKELEAAKDAMGEKRTQIIAGSPLLTNSQVEEMFKNVVSKRYPCGEWFTFVDCRSENNGSIRVSFQYIHDVTWKYAHPSYVYLEYDNTEHIDSSHKDYKATLSKQRDNAKNLIEFLKSLQKADKNDKEVVYSDLSVGDKGIIEFHVGRSIVIPSRRKEDVEQFVKKF